MVSVKGIFLQVFLLRNCQSQYRFRDTNGFFQHNDEDLISSRWFWNVYRFSSKILLIYWKILLLKSRFDVYVSNYPYSIFMLLACVFTTYISMIRIYIHVMNYRVTQILNASNSNILSKVNVGSICLTRTNWNSLEKNWKNMRVWHSKLIIMLLLQ